MSDAASLDALVARLRPRYPRAAALVERWGSAPIDRYAEALWGSSTAAPGPVDPRLLAALRVDLQRTYGADDPRIEAALRGLTRHRTLGTTAHVAPAYGPVFAAADLLLARGGSTDAPAIVTAWTALPFNNASSPGCVTFGGDPAAIVRRRTPTWRRLRQSRAARGGLEIGERRLSFIRAREQRHLVYRHPRPALLGRTLADLQPAAAELLGRPREDDAFPTWARRSCARVQAAILARAPLIVDLNEVATTYLLSVLEDSDNPLRRALFEAPARAELRARFPDAPWFLGRTRGAKGERLATIVPEGERLVGLAAPLPLRPAPLARALSRGELCPGLLLSYAALVGLSGLRCVGGLRQTIYLPAMAARWRDLGWAAPSPADDRPDLLLGRLVDDAGRAAHALDLALEGRAADPLAPGDAPMSRLWAPLAELL